MADLSQRWIPFFLHVLVITLLEHGVDCLQCYSCKATGSNELDANIKCLENAYLENCEEFYDYYNEIEDQDVISYEYYYYEKPDDNKPGEKPGEAGSRGGGAARDVDTKDVASARAGFTRREDLNPKRNKRAVEKKKKDDDPKGNENEVSDEDEDYPEYYYEYEYVDDDNVTSTQSTKFNDLDVRTSEVSRAQPKNEKKNDKKEDKKSKSEPQHYCYSQAFKSNWESYTVEKGCKKISYCKNSVENKPEWAHPWNFCCDRSRCNVKLVKDKPQRVFGMGCRRQDDCIQGHISRSLCPHYFKSCPKISSSMVKMECRVKARTMGAVKNGPKYRHQFREKKCYCSKGYYPRGPICTSGSARVVSSILSSLVFVSLWVWH